MNRQSLLKIFVLFACCFLIGFTIPGSIVLFSSQNDLTESVQHAAYITTVKEELNITSPSLTIALTGDILLAGKVFDQIQKNGVNYPWEKVKETLTAADFAVGNLECAVSRSGSPQKGKTFTFRADPVVLEGVKWAGLDGLTLANNHILDFGRTALAETLNYLKKYNLKSTGAGWNKKDASQPIIFEKDGLKVGILAYSRVIPTTDWLASEERSGLISCYNPDEFLTNVQSLKNKVDVLIASVHWGKELADYPLPYQRELAHDLIDAGADIVFGHHPHTLQGMETYKNGLIIYSAGNFIFTTSITDKCQTGMIALITFNQNGWQTCKVIPTKIYAAQTSVLTGKEKAQVISRLNLLSQPFGLKLKADGIIQRTN